MTEDNKNTDKQCTIHDVVCRDCKFITDYDYVYDEDILWERPIGKCGNQKSENFGYEMEADEYHDCKHHDS